MGSVSKQGLAQGAYSWQPSHRGAAMIRDGDAKYSEHAIAKGPIAPLDSPTEQINERL